MTMGKQHRLPQCTEKEDGSSDDPESSNQLFRLSDNEFGEKIWNILIVLKEAWKDLNEPQIKTKRIRTKKK